MSFGRKNKNEGQPKESTSAFSKFKSKFAKDKTTGSPEASRPQQNQPAQYQYSQQPAASGPSGGWDQSRQNPAPLQPSYGGPTYGYGPQHYRPPHPQRTSPIQSPSTFDHSRGYHPPPPGHDESYSHSPTYPVSHVSTYPAQGFGNSGGPPPEPLYHNQQSLRPFTSVPQQQISRPSSAQGQANIPQLVFVQAPENDYSESDDDDEKVVFLVQTNDGRYLPVNFNPAGRISRAPSPSVMVAGRQEQQRVIYLDQDSESSTESLYGARPGSSRRDADYDERRNDLNQRFNVNQSDEDEDDEEFHVPSPPSVNPGIFTPNGSQAPNLNRRYDYLPESMVPFWYDKDAVPAPEGSRQYLCTTCRHIDLLALFRQEETDVVPKPRDFIFLGSLMSMFNRKGCGLCSLVTAMVAFDTGVDLPLIMSDEEKKDIQRTRLIELMEEVYYLCPIRFKTTYRTPALYIYSGKEVGQLSKQSSTARPRRSMAIRPIHRFGPNLGRLLLKPDQIDFEWIRERMRLCDERDVGRLDYRHSVNVRAIDVQDMCIIDLKHGVRYVTLSYVWGQAKQIELKKGDKRFFQNGGLRAIWKELPKTIQDCITLVQRIGERFLWIDALCIFQGDEKDMNEQIGAMGEIYGNSILTICACAGQDAMYGLPGMEPGTRKTRQVAEVVGNLVIGNTMADSEALEGVKWDTRAWTMQEKVLSQRKLYISDNHALWWCWHTITAEDENCRHDWWEPGTRHRGMFFYKSDHDLVLTTVPKKSNMDTYAYIVADYTARNMTHQSDAERAVMGALSSIEGMFRGTFVQCLPDTEMDAALLWCPLGSVTRRIDPTTGKPLFPSWSWLGWNGHAAYPWLIERTLPMSEQGCPIRWKSSKDNKWFTSEMYRLNGRTINASEQGRRQAPRWIIDDEGGWTWIDQDDDSRNCLHPVEQHGWLSSARPYSYFDKSSQQLHFQTLSAHFSVEPRIRIRKENHNYLHKVRLRCILNTRGLSVGYIYVPDETSMSAAERSKFTDGTKKEFVVLSRASTIADPRIGQELLTKTPLSELHSVYSMSYMVNAIDRLQPSQSDDEEESEVSNLDEKAYFDTRLYDATMPWGLFNVMMIERVGDVAYRLAIGRIHVAAFMEEGPEYKEIVLE